MAMLNDQRVIFPDDFRMFSSNFRCLPPGLSIVPSTADIRGQYLKHKKKGRRTTQVLRALHSIPMATILVWLVASTNPLKNDGVRQLG